MSNIADYIDDENYNPTRLTVRPAGVKVPEAPLDAAPTFDPFAPPPPENPKKTGSEQGVPAGFDPFAPPPSQAEQAVRGVRDLAGRAGTALSPTVARGREALDQAIAAADEATGGKPDVDYKTGGPFFARVALSRASNPNEAELALKKYFGDGNYGQDDRGNWWVNQDDKKVAVFPRGFTESFKNAGAGMTASATPMAGSILGGALGIPLGPFGMFAGAGLGAGAGHLVDQGVKWGQGLFDQSPAELAKHTMNETTLNAALPAGLHGAKAVGRGLGNAVRDWMGTTETTRAMAARLEAEGARPPIISVAPDARSLADKQKLRNQIAGNPHNEGNTQFIRDRFENALRSSGLPEEEVAALTAQSRRNQVEALSSSAPGEAVADAAATYLGDRRAAAETALNEAQQSLRQLDLALRREAHQPIGRVGQDVADTIVGSRQRFGQSMSRMYREIDNMNGGARVVDLDDTLQAARGWVDRATPDITPQYLRRLAERGEAAEAARTAIPAAEQAEREIATNIAALRSQNQPIPQPMMEAHQAAQARLGQLRETAETRVPFSEAHEIRTNLRGLVEDNLTRSSSDHKISDVERTLNGTFSDLAASNNLGAQAAQALRRTDTLYGQGIQQYYDNMLRKLVRDVRSGMVPDAEFVASTILKQGRTEATENLMRMLSPELRERVARADLRNMIDDASVRGRDGQMHLDGMKWLDQLDKRERVAGLLHSPQRWQQFRTLGEHYAAINGDMDVAHLPPNQITRAIQQYVSHVRDVDAFVKHNPLAEYATSRSPLVMQRAADALTEPGKELLTRQAATMLGTDSEAWRQLQRYALQKLVRDAFRTSASRIRSVSGSKIENVMERYTREQQELLFPNGLADDIQMIAKEANFLFPDALKADYATSQAAKAITLHTGPGIWNPRTAYADYRWASSYLSGWLIDRPVLLRFLANSARENPKEARGMLATIARRILPDSITIPKVATFNTEPAKRKAVDTAGAFNRNRRALYGPMGRWWVNGQTMGPGRGRPTEQQEP